MRFEIGLSSNKKTQCHASTNDRVNEVEMGASLGSRRVDVGTCVTGMPIGHVLRSSAVSKVYIQLF
jgi:hypothetical protein